MSSPSTYRRQPTRSHIGLMAVLGIAGWSVLLAPGWVPGLVPDVQPSLTGLSVLFFMAVVVAARSLAFSPLPGTVVSMDSGFYVAATLCVGAIASGRLIALALTVDALLRLITGPRNRTRREWLDAAVYVGYFGGMSGALLAGVGRIFNADTTALVFRSNEWRVFGSVAAIGIVFISIHYSIQAVRSRLSGAGAAVYMTRLGLPSVLAELTLLPIAAVVVYVFDPDHLLGVGLLGGTYLLIGFGFKRLSRVGTDLRKRVIELETLSSTSTRLASCLQIHRLIEAVAEATTDAIGTAEALSFCRFSADGTFDVDSFVVKTGEFERREGRKGHDLVSRVVSENQPVWFSSEKPTTGLALQRAKSWLGVPVRVFGEVRALLAVESSSQAVFSDADRFLLEGIASQTSGALQNAEHYELAMVDGLTRLFVRRYFDKRLDEEVERSRRYGTDFSVVMMDIDDFKALNDAYGHAAGDDALKMAANVVRAEMRGIDTAARYGGEEFALVLPRTGLTEALALAERIREKLATVRLEIADSKVPVEMTASFGIASFPEGQAKDGDELLRQADRALYRAKRTGKNRVELYWQEDDSQHRARSNGG